MSDYYSLPWKETIYKNTTYHSKLEAYWQAFFDHLGIVANYHPRIFQIPELSGTPEFYYTPDFGLLSMPYPIIEIKPNMRQANGVINQAILKLKSVSLHYQIPTALVAGSCYPGAFDIAFFRDGEVVRSHIGWLNRVKNVFGLSRKEAQSVLVLKMLLGNHKADYMAAFKYSREVIK